MSERPDSFKIEGGVLWERKERDGHVEWCTPWATVFDNAIWHTWDANGVGGENSGEYSVQLAMMAAINSAVRQGFYTPEPTPDSEVCKTCRKAKVIASDAFCSCSAAALNAAAQHEERDEWKDRYDALYTIVHDMADWAESVTIADSEAAEYDEKERVKLLARFEALNKEEGDGG